MGRYFFDLIDAGRAGHVGKDDTGTEFSDLNEVRKAAMRYLPDIARETIPENKDFRSIAVVVRDEGGRPIYSATLSVTGLWLAF